LDALLLVQAVFMNKVKGWRNMRWYDFNTDLEMSIKNNG
jgi:hypothetical protein